MDSWDDTMICDIVLHRSNLHDVTHLQSNLADDQGKRTEVIVS